MATARSRKSLATRHEHDAAPDRRYREPNSGTRRLINQLGDKKTRVFYTSLGHAEDFESPAFRKLLQNGVLWPLGVLEPRSGGAPLAAK